jgi:hypothetical protein
MDLKQRVNAFLKLGKFLSQFSSEGIQKKENIDHNDLFFEGFKHQIKLAQEHNGWFTNENICFTFTNLSKSLINSNANF